MASVADQKVELEHIVQDACSDDGTQAWLAQEKRVLAFIEKDQGMYDAVNRGLRRARGDILSYLNCDEQDLPGALEKVGDFLSRHADVDILFAGAVVVDAAGEYLCDRRPLIPQRLHTLVSANLSFLTAAAFFRRRVVEQHGLFFDPKLRVVGDAMWSLAATEAGLKMATLSEFTSAFTETGANLCLSPHGLREQREMFVSAPFWAQRAAPLIVAHFRFRRWLAGHYRCRPYSYAIYTSDSPERRKTFRVDNPTFRWRR